MKIAPIVLIAVSLVLGIFLRLHFQNVTTRTPDENYYTYYAQNIALKGIGETPALVQQYNDNKNDYIYPAPNRIGYLYLLAAWMKITGLTCPADGWHNILCKSIDKITQKGDTLMCPLLEGDINPCPNVF